MRILWADDQRDVAKTLSLGISGGHKITFVEDGTKALGLVSDGFFDIVILDLAMPPGEWGGLWFLEQLRGLGHRVPVIVLSGEGRQPETIKAIRLGARDFVTKEAASRELEQRLTTTLNELWSEIDKIILTSFPCPLALSYKRYMAGVTPQSRMRAVFDIYEQTIKLAGIIGLAEASQHAMTIPFPLMMRLGRPSIGTWHEVVRALLKLLPDGVCVRRFWRALDGSPIDDVISTRNSVAHGFEFGERKAGEWLSAHEPALRLWLARLWQRFPFRLFSVLSSAYDGTRLIHNTVAIEGESPVLPKRVVTSKKNLVLHHVWMMQTCGDNDDVVSLYPLLLAEHGDALDTWRAYLFHGWQANPDIPLTGSEPLRYLELWTGEQMDRLGPVVNSLPNSIWQNAMVDPQGPRQ